MNKKTQLRQLIREVISDEINESMNPLGKQDPQTLNKFLSVLGGTTPKIDPEGPVIGTEGELDIILKYLAKAAAAGKIRNVNIEQFKTKAIYASMGAGARKP